MMTRSIRHTLTLWYQGILAIVLCLFSGALYTTVATSLHRTMDRSLLLQGANIADTMAAFWRAERAAPFAGPGNWVGSPSATFQAVVDSAQLPGLVARWTEKTGGLQTGLPIRLVDRLGRSLGESASMKQFELPAASAGLTTAGQGHGVFETITVSKERVRLLTDPVMDGDRVLYLIQVAHSLDALDDSLAKLRLWLGWLIPLTLIGTSAIGWFLAMQALQPVGRMTLQAQRISAERLDQRLDVPRSGDELERLATTFNDLLIRLEHAFRRLRQFSAAASHELRTPLTVMKGELEVSLRKPRTNDSYREVLRMQLQMVDEMTHIVEELLALARSDAAKETLERSPVELGVLAQQASDMWRRLTEAKAIQLDIRASSPVWVNGESRLLERLVANLLDNAIRHTPAQGTITVCVEPQDHQACFSIHDSGSGIPEEDLPHVFDRFFKPAASSNGASSTGLGLGLCRWIVEAHAGQIQVVSPPAQGTTVTVWFPLSSAPKALPA